jgi:hypothetical protein
MARMFRLIPQTVPYFDLFQRSADLNAEGARVLSAILEGGGDLERNASALKDIEHRADENTHEIFGALNVSFVTPLDREDISALASALDDVIDWIEEASRRIRLYQIAQPTPLARRFGSVILEQATQVSGAIPLLRSGRGSTRLEEANREIHRLENEADDIFAEALAHLYDGVTEIPDLIRAIRWGDVYAVLETATDKAEHVAIVMHNIALKHG